MRIARNHIGSAPLCSRFHRSQRNNLFFPKRCGHFAGKAIISTDEMVQKIKAAVDTRRDGDLQIIARTAVSGLSEAIDRAHDFVDAGADVTFVEAPENLEELTQITKSISVPQVANIVFGGKTPDPGREAFAEMGFSIVLYANTVLQAALRGAYAALGSLKEEGDLSAAGDLLASFEERQRSVAKHEWDALEARYRLPG
jgi:2-methylisocitrate lyase-like PEP mutase family enzyme